MALMAGCLIYPACASSSEFYPANETQRWGMYDDTPYDRSQSDRSSAYNGVGDVETLLLKMIFNVFFGVVQSVGEAGNRGQADTALMNSACSLFEEKGSAAIGQALDTSDMSSPSWLQQFSGGGRLQSVVFSRARQGMDDAVSAGLSSLCSSLTGQGQGGAGLAGGLNIEELQAMGLNFALNENLNMLKSSGLPFTEHLEVSAGLEDGEYTWEVLTVQPLWVSKSGRNHLFTQLSFNRNEDVGDTINVGLAARRLTENRSVVYGVNAFLDHARTMNHNRMSVGADVQTPQLGLAVNKYIPLSGWKSVDDYTEERASSGFDIELQGRLPEFPSWQLNLTGYKWSSNDDHEQASTFGYDTALEWRPVNALVWEAGLRNEQDDAPQFHTQLRFIYKFGEKLDTMWERPVALASAEERVYEKVHRENTIRTERRTKDSAYVRVTQTDGANVVQTASGSRAVQDGQKLAMPFRINVSSAAGSIVALRFQNGATLTIGAGSIVRVEARLITLVFGVMHYVSGSEDVALAAPGASIALLGTDVDLSSNGTTSTLRVRDGSARITGTSSGSALLTPEQAADSVSGVVGAQLASSDANYINHADEVSAKIDRIANPITGTKVAPYPIAAPHIVSGDSSTIVLGLKFNGPVSVSGGPPRLTLTINGISGTAALSGGSGTDTLLFTYTRVPGDLTASSLTCYGYRCKWCQCHGQWQGCRYDDCRRDA
ncbi:MAG: inverse autotransporter beta domain-containing protein [Alphaproteobacteria bacterium]|nr:inverse autotransporter beta domain-containing protein [Alphaproteobacteria bacterium]